MILVLFMTDKLNVCLILTYSICWTYMTSIPIRGVHVRKEVLTSLDELKKLVFMKSSKDWYQILTENQKSGKIVKYTGCATVILPISYYYATCNTVSPMVAPLLCCHKYGYILYMARQ